MKKWKELTKNQKIFAGVLLTIVIILDVYLIFNFDTAFKADTTIRYENGCYETYHNGKLTSDPCPVEDIVFINDMPKLNITLISDNKNNKNIEVENLSMDDDISYNQPKFFNTRG